MANKSTKADCRGCHNDVYNHSDFGMNKRPDGTFQCWQLESATLVKARDVHVDMPPPYLHLQEVARPSCYKAERMCRVKATALDEKGFWK
jgi:hypothetical protein